MIHRYSIETFHHEDAPFYDEIDRIPSDIMQLARLALALSGDDARRPSLDIVNAAVDSFCEEDPYIVRDHNSENRIVAMALYEPHDTNRRSTENSAWLDLMAVDRSVRALGIGSMLLGHLKEVANHDNVDAIRLRSLTAPEVINFYTKHGFSIERPDPRGPIMRFDLSRPPLGVYK